MQIRHTSFAVRRSLPSSKPDRRCLPGEYGASPPGAASSTRSSASAYSLKSQPRASGSGSLANPAVHEGVVHQDGPRGGCAGRSHPSSRVPVLSASMNARSTDASAGANGACRRPGERARSGRQARLLPVLPGQCGPVRVDVAAGMLPPGASRGPGRCRYPVNVPTSITRRGAMSWLSSVMNVPCSGPICKRADAESGGTFRTARQDRVGGWVRHDVP
jgi:hypothetical protein